MTTLRDLVTIQLGGRRRGRGRRIGLGVLAVVAVVGGGLLYRWWTSWPVRVAIPIAGTNWPREFSPDGATLATAGYNGVRLWDAATGRLRSSWDFPQPAERFGGVLFSPDGRILAASWRVQGPPEAPAVNLIDAATGREIAAIPIGGADQLGGLSFADHLGGLSFSADGRSLRLAGIHKGDVEVIDYDIPAGRITSSRHLSGGAAWDRAQLGLFPDGRLLAVVPYNASPRPGYSADVRLWDVDEGREVGRLPGPPGGSGIRTSSFSGRPTALVLAREDGSLEVWDIAKDRLRPTATLRGHRPDFVPCQISLSPDASTLVSVGALSPISMTVTSVRWRLGRQVDRLLGVRRAVGDSGRPMEVIVLDVKTGRRLARIDDEGIPVFAPDGRTLATTDGKSVKIRDVPGRP